jgi:antitoxin (DNA-binding transcriptional repressor) of toxin-antitoxin stability system
MDIVDIREVETHLFRLIKNAAAGESFIIAEGGKPMVKVVPLNTNLTEQKRVGFLLGRFKVPDDFNRLGRQEINRIF